MLALILVYQPLSMSAVIEVTAGGTVNELPTYKFSDASGSFVATLTANVTNGKITASGVLEASDVQTTSGASLNSKMDAMTVDSTPTDGSSNLVRSNGVYDALSGKLGSGVAYSGITGSMWPHSWGDGDPIHGIISRNGFDCSCLPGAAGTCSSGHCAHWFTGVWKEEVIPTMNTVMALVNSQSDERTKGNWRTFENASAMINSLTKLGTFEFVGGPGETPLSSSLFHLPLLVFARLSHRAQLHAQPRPSLSGRSRNALQLHCHPEPEAGGALRTRSSQVFARVSDRSRPGKWSSLGSVSGRLCCWAKGDAGALRASQSASNGDCTAQGRGCTALVASRADG